MKRSANSSPPPEIWQVSPPQKWLVCWNISSKSVQKEKHYWWLLICSDTQYGGMMLWISKGGLCLSCTEQTLKSSGMKKVIPPSKKDSGQMLWLVYTSNMQHRIEWLEGGIIPRLDSVALLFRNHIHYFGPGSVWDSHIAAMSSSAFDHFRLITQLCFYLDEGSLRTLVENTGHLPDQLL